MSSKKWVPREPTADNLESLVRTELFRTPLGKDVRVKTDGFSREVVDEVARRFKAIGFARAERVMCYLVLSR